MLSFLHCRNATNYIKLQTFYRSFTKNVRQKDSKPFNFSCRYPFRINNVREYGQKTKADSFHVNVNIKNNVLLYKYENPRYFRTFRAFCFIWIFFSSVLSYYTFDPKFILTWRKNVSWAEYLKLNGTNLLYFVYAIIVGPSAFFLLYMANKKFVKFIILHPGGTSVSLVTHHLFKRQDVLTVPVNKVTAICSRNRMRDYLPLKVQGKSFYYLVDAEGKFINEKLFDCTVGTRK
ncbi:transmembrane protein 223 isoform X1 [Megachile rotundata]|uniref:transmembrane protein 223 isoform X1 n=1 Tax=Megachile rotundata TaxID=143995 RepID=UPI003FD582DD